MIWCLRASTCSSVTFGIVTILTNECSFFLIAAVIPSLITLGRRSAPGCDGCHISDEIRNGCWLLLPCRLPHRQHQRRCRQRPDRQQRERQPVALRLVVNPAGEYLPQQPAQRRDRERQTLDRS